MKASRRYKIIKKIADSKRKKAKEAKKLPKLKSAKAKLIQIPNICPFKEDILNEVEADKARRELEKKQRVEELKAQSKQKTLEDVAANAASMAIKHTLTHEDNNDDEEIEYAKPKGREGSLKAYFKDFKKVVDAADVILEVVDARDPLGTRCQEVTQIVRETGGKKRLVLILNKADLVPRENLDKWLNYLRKFGPVVPFKATTQVQKNKIGRRKFKQTKSFQCSPCIGADLLMSLLANYSRNKDIKTAIRVGIVGIPNVGKSSIVNSLKRQRSCLVGAKPGVTRTNQEVIIDSNIKLIDSPGIIFQKPTDESPDHFFALRNAQNVTDIQDPFALAEDILKRASMMYFCKLYELTEFHSVEEFLARKAIKMGKLGKGGAPDVRAAARSLITDWNIGKIKYCTHPPEDENESDIHLGASILTSAEDNAKEFNIEDFEKVQSIVLDSLNERFEADRQDELDVMEIESQGSVQMKLSKHDSENKSLESLMSKTTSRIIEDYEEELDGEAELKKLTDRNTVNNKKRRVDDYSEEAKKMKKDPVFRIDGGYFVISVVYIMFLNTSSFFSGNKTMNKSIKNDQKKLKKLKSRNVKKVDNVTDVLENFSLGTTAKKRGASNDNYDFGADFDM